MLTADASSLSTLGGHGGSGAFSFSFNIKVESEPNLQEKKLNQLKFENFSWTHERSEVTGQLFLEIWNYV